MSLIIYTQQTHSILEPVRNPMKCQLQIFFFSLTDQNLVLQWKDVPV